MVRRFRSRAIRPVAAELPLTLEQQRTVQCPRCGALPRQPCRNQYGKAVSAGHAVRQRVARRRLAGKLYRAVPEDKPLTREEHAELVERKRRVRDPALLVDPRRGPKYIR